MFELTKEFSFHAAHSLKFLPVSHKCSRLHGHTYRVLFTVGGELDPDRGWVVDFGEMARAADELYHELDHHYLNEIEGLEEPTAELIAKYIFDRLVRRFPGLLRVTVYETPTSSCTYSPAQGVLVRLGPFRFSAAHVVANEAFDEALHGHDFELTVECYAEAGEAMRFKEILHRAVKRVIQGVEHRTFLPGDTATVSEGWAEFEWGGRVLHLRREDVVLVGCAHATAECIALELGRRLRSKLQESCTPIKLYLREEPGTLVSVSVD